MAFLSVKFATPDLLTGFPVAVLPGRPGKPIVQPGSITAVIMWENGDSGNVPFEKFEIQSQTDGKQFVVPFVAKHGSASKNLKQQMQ